MTVAELKKVGGGHLVIIISLLVHPFPYLHTAIPLLHISNLIFYYLGNSLSFPSEYQRTKSLPSGSVFSTVCVVIIIIIIIIIIICEMFLGRLA